MSCGVQIGMALCRAKHHSNLKSARESAERQCSAKMSFIRSSTRNGVVRSQASCGFGPMSADAPYRRMIKAIKHREELNFPDSDRVRGSTFFLQRYRFHFYSATDFNLLQVSTHWLWSPSEFSLPGTLIRLPIQAIRSFQKPYVHA